MSLTSFRRCLPLVTMWPRNSRLLGRLGRHRAVVEQLGEADDRVERRAQLVRHAGQERALLAWFAVSASSLARRSSCCSRSRSVDLFLQLRSPRAAARSVSTFDPSSACASRRPSSIRLRSMNGRSAASALDHRQVVLVGGARLAAEDGHHADDIGPLRRGSRRRLAAGSPGLLLHDSSLQRRVGDPTAAGGGSRPGPADPPRPQRSVPARRASGAEADEDGIAPVPTGADVDAARAAALVDLPSARPDPSHGSRPTMRRISGAASRRCPTSPAAGSGRYWIDSSPSVRWRSATSRSSTA